MEWVEITAKTIDVAKERALDELGIDHDEAEFVVLEEPRRGLFGQVRGKARVRARVKPHTPRPKAERRNRREKQGRSKAKSSDGGSEQAKKDTSSKAKEAASAGNGDRRSAGKQKAKKPSSETRKPAAKSGRTTETAKERGTKMTMTLDEQVTASEDFLGGLLEALGIDGSITTERSDDDNAHVNIEGDDLGWLIGPRGQTMKAIQDLTRIRLQREAAGSWEGHVHVDINGYWAKRRQALVEFVQKVAADVIDSGTAKALEPMSAADRKVVHDTVNGIEGVQTSSEGHDPRRWVKISPDDA